MTVEDLQLQLLILNITLGALSVLFSLFTAAIAFAAIWEWKSYRNFQKKKGEAMIQYKQIIEQMVTETENFKKEANLILGFKKQSGKKQNKEQEKRLNDLICQMENIIKKAENKLSTTETSYPLTSSVYLGNASGTTFTSSSMEKLNYNNTYSLYPKKCTKCERNYYPPLGVLDNGMCDDCNGNNSSFATRK